MQVATNTFICISTKLIKLSPHLVPSPPYFSFKNLIKICHLKIHIYTLYSLKASRLNKEKEMDNLILDKRSEKTVQILLLKRGESKSHFWHILIPLIPSSSTSTTVSTTLSSRKEIKSAEKVLFFKLNQQKRCHLSSSWSLPFLIVPLFCYFPILYARFFALI